MTFLEQFAKGLENEEDKNDILKRITDLRDKMED